MAVIRNLVVKIGADISGLSNGLKSAQKKLSKLSKTLEKAGRGLTRNITLPLMALGTVSVKAAMELESSLASAAAGFSGTASEVENLTKTAKAMSKGTVHSVSQVADALKYMQKAGYGAAEMTGALDSVMALATGTETELAETTKAVISTLNLFGLDITSADRAANVFAAVISRTGISMESLKNGLSIIAPYAKSAGYSIEEMSGAIAVLNNAGYSGEESGTLLKSMLERLEKPTQSMIQTLSGLGLSAEDVAPSANSLADIISKLEKSGLSSSQAMSLFGESAGTAMMAMVGGGAESLETLTASFTGTSAASELADKHLRTLAGTMKQVKTTLNDVAVQLGEVIMPMIKRFLTESIMPLTVKFGGLSDGTKELIVKIAMIAAAVGPAILVIAKIVKAVSAFSGVLSFLTGPIGWIVIAIAALVLIFVKLFKTNEEFRQKVLAIWERIKSGINAAITAVKQWWERNGEAILTSVKQVFEAIFTVISIVCEAVFEIFRRLGKSLQKLWDDNESFRKAVIDIWEGIKQGIMSAVTAIREWWERNGEAVMESVVTVFGYIWDFIVGVLDGIIKSLEVFFGYLEPIWEQIKQLFLSLWDVLCELYELLEPVFLAIGGIVVTLAGVVAGVINGIIQALGPLIQAVLNLLQIVVDVVGAIVCLFKGDFAGAFEHLKNIGTGFVEFFKNIWQALLNFGKGFVEGFCGVFRSLGIDIEQIVKGIVDGIVGFFTGLWNTVKDIFTNIKDAITGAFNSVKDAIGNLVSSAFDWGKNVIQSIIDGIKSMINKVGDAVKGVADKIKNFLGFGSPTKEGPGSEADEWMPNFTGMITKGIQKGIPDIESAVFGVVSTLSLTGEATIPSGVGAGNTSIGADVVNGMLQAMSVAGTSDNNGNTPVELSIDGQVFARIIMPKILKEFRRNGIAIKEGGF